MPVSCSTDIGKRAASLRDKHVIIRKPCLDGKVRLANGTFTDVQQTENKRHTKS